MDESPAAGELEHFRKLFWEANKRSNTPEERGAALVYAAERGWEWAAPLLEALRLVPLGEPAQALQLLEHLEVPDALTAEAHYTRGLAHRRAEANEEAAAAFEQALASPGLGNPGAALRRLGDCMADLDSKEAAVNLYHEALETPGYKSHGVTWFNLGITLEELDRPEQAIEAYHHAAEAGYKKWMVLDSIGLLHYYEDESETAIEFFKRSLEEAGHKKPGDTWDNLGRAYLDLGKAEKAIESFHKALELPGHSPGAVCVYLGRAHAKQGRHQEAIEAFRKSLEDPKYKQPGEAWDGLADSLGKSGQHEEAIAAYRKALREPGNSTPANTWFNLGTAYHSTGQFESAVDCFSQSLAASIDDPRDAWYEKGHNQLKLGRHAEALECFGTALENEGDIEDGDCLHAMAVAYGNLGDFATAEQCYRKALGDPNYSSPHISRLNFSIDLRDAGRREEAEAQIRRVLSEPDREGEHGQARFLLGVLEGRENGDRE